VKQALRILAQVAAAELICIAIMWLTR